MNILRPIQKEYYGDDNRWWLGYVINSSPPPGLEGRVKVRIIGIHNKDTNEIPEADLPWAQVLIPTTEGGSSGIGRIPQISKGAFVFGIFLDGSTSQIPLVFGSLPHTEIPSSIQKSRRVYAPFIDKFNYDQSRIQNVVIQPLLSDDDPTGDPNIRRLQCMKFFIDNNYEPLHASAITAALESASNFQTVSNSPEEGIAKWKLDGSTGSRYSELLRFASSYRPATDWKLYSTQLQFVLFELRNRFNLVNGKLKQTQTIQEATQAISKYTNKTAPTNLAQKAYDEVFSV